MQYVPIVTKPFGIASNIVHTHNRLPIDLEEKKHGPNSNPSKIKKMSRIFKKIKSKGKQFENVESLQHAKWKLLAVACFQHLFQTFSFRYPSHRLWMWCVKVCWIFPFSTVQFRHEKNKNEYPTQVSFIDFTSIEYYISSDKSVYRITFWQHPYSLGRVSLMFFL